MKRKQAYSLFLPLIILHLFSFSQDLCGFDHKHRQKIQTDSVFKRRVSQTERDIQDYIRKNNNRISARVTTTNSLALYTIPVVVHVVHTGGAVGSIYNPSDGQIQGAIDYLNQVYNGTYPGTSGIGDLEIQFALAVRDPNCNATNGIDRINGASVANYSANGVNVQTVIGADELNIKNLSRWNPLDYYNIWVVNKIDGLDGTSGSFIGGFAWFPGSPFELDGTIMLATQMQSGRKSLPHEMGHAFGLFHPFEGGDATTCPANTSCTADGDRVCDTDPITQPTGFVCRTGINSCSGTNYSSNTEQNYMNYTNCYNLFTSGQKSRLLAAAANIYRISLSNSSALIPTNTIFPYINPVSATCSPATGTAGLNNDYAGIFSVQVNNKTYKTLTPFLDYWYLNAPLGYVDASGNCLKLVELMRGGSYNFSARVVDANIHQLRAWIDYNNDGAFTDGEEIHSNSSFGSPQAFTTAGTFTVPNDATVNTVLRVRVIDDLVPGYPSTVAIANGCHSPVYGQVEDYAVYISSPIALPVTLVNFNGAIKGDKIVLNWVTANEQGLKNFDLEKSIDGSNFHLIGKLKAEGYHNATKSYSFDDPDIANTNYYRIRMNDMDGQSKLSDIILINADDRAQKLILQKNPIDDAINIKLAKTARQIKLQLLSIDGKLVGEKAFYNTSGVHWQPQAMSRGMYILRAMIDGKEFTTKLVKQ